MRQNVNILFGLRVLLAVAAVIFLFNGRALSSDFHSFSERDCNSCHSGETERTTWQKTRPTADVSPQCVNCHGSCESWREHRDRSAEPSAMTVSLPLREEGRIVCVTCHDPHIETLPGLSSTLRISNLKRELCLNCHRSGNGGIAVEVVIPPPGVIVRDDYIPLLGKILDGEEDYLSVTINGAAFPVPVRDGIFHTRLRVREGLNRITVTLEDRLLWEGEVFQSPGSGATGKYGRVFLGHQTASLDECLSCHTGREGSFAAATAPAPELCYGCHEPLDDKRFLHGPLAVGECLSCHDPHGGVGPFHLKDKEVSLCLSCHDAGSVQQHGGWQQAMAEGSCSTCHDPHQSDTRFLVRHAGLGF